MSKGKLFLIPTELGEGALHPIPEYVVEKIHALRYFIAERAKTARHFIKSTKPPYPISDLTVMELNKRVDTQEKKSFLQPLLDGKDVGLVSEAGCPGVADPGAEIVKMAHERGIEVHPLVGPSSILLALMGSGMNGQSFAFNGYLSPKKPQLSSDLKRMEQLSAKHRQTQIFIETPYRNNGFVETALSTLSTNTRFCIACDLTLSSQYIVTKTVANWRKSEIPDLHKRLAVFLILV